MDGFASDGRTAYTTLDASGLSVGLPAGLMGNSEVGHLNIGAGRPIYQVIFWMLLVAGVRNKCSNVWEKYNWEQSQEEPPHTSCHIRDFLCTSQLCTQISFKDGIAGSVREAGVMISHWTREKKNYWGDFWDQKVAFAEKNSHIILKNPPVFDTSCWCASCYNLKYI